MAVSPHQPEEGRSGAWSRAAIGKTKVASADGSAGPPSAVRGGGVGRGLVPSREIESAVAVDVAVAVQVEVEVEVEVGLEIDVRGAEHAATDSSPIANDLTVP